MKKILYIVLGVLAVLAMAFFGLLFYTKSHSPTATAETSENGLNIKVEYCQPSKKGREVFGKLVPFDKVWRTGANKSATITFGQDTKIGDKQLKKGTYSLFTIPTAGKWTIIINSIVGDWGAFSYKQDKDVLRVEVESKSAEAVTEMFTITFEKADKTTNMVLAWGKTRTTVPMNQ